MRRGWNSSNFVVPLHLTHATNSWGQRVIKGGILKPPASWKVHIFDGRARTEDWKEHGFLMIELKVGVVVMVFITHVVKFLKGMILEVGWDLYKEREKEEG
uniref:Uncharacterized protein n=1 Tax=Lotus japonicus TaxID=34305 RepID=I3T659_LOTJA|nr:unknown [Lotus japonicus]